MNVLEEAAGLINGDRQEQYGNATESHTRIADLWAAYLNTDVTEFDVVNMMVLLKVSRTRNTYHRDSYVDIAGYAGLGERLFDEATEDGSTISVEELADWERELLRVARPRAPRVWESMDHIQVGVNVLDKDGDSWDAEVISEQVLDRDGTGAYADKWAPFTEVLETDA